MKKRCFTLVALLTASTSFAQWVNQSSGVTNDLNGVSFVDANTGWVAGRQGTILKTTNGGSSWTAENSGANTDLNDVFMVSANVGYAVGKSGKIAKYNGTTWSAANSGETRDIFGVSFISELEGWAVGDWGRLYHTTNGGSSWANQNDPTASTKFNAICMLNASAGWAVGTAGKIMRYNGSNWGGQTSGITDELLGVDFLNPNFGFAVGKKATILFYDGTSWSQHNTGLSNNSYSIYDVKIISQNEAYAAVTPGFGGAGIILKYNGTTWSQDYEYTDMGTELFYGISAPSSSKIYAVGSGGLIKAKGGTTALNNVDAKNNAVLFPNPMLTSATLKTDMELNNATLSIYNLVGKNVKEWSNISGNTFTLDKDNMPEGVYIYELREGENILYSGKLVVESF